MGAAQNYLHRIQTMLCCLEETQMDAIVRAGTLCADALMGGHRIYVTPKGTHCLPH